MTAKETAGAPAPPHRRPGPATRRRGSKLEAAILQAAWDELTEDGYAAFTMERVAVRAKTSRAVLYRRWPNRPELVVAALAHHAQLAPMDVPDTGTLRDDLLALLRRMSEGVGEAAGVLSFFIAEYSRETGQPLSTLRERAIADTPKTQMTLILEHAIARGEIDPGRLSPRIASLPVDLVRHDLIMTQAPVPDGTLVEIVDKIFLPLVRASEPRSSLT
jgi:AcrR family transcriptional regulator